MGGFSIGENFGFGNISSLGELASRFILPGFSIAALIITFYFIYAGWKYLTSGDNKDELAKARAMIIHSIIGFLLLMVAFLVVQFITEFFGLPFKIIQ